MAKSKIVVDDQLSPLELHALKIAAKPSEKVRDRLEAGTAQHVDITVRVAGAINVGGPNTATVSQKPAIRTMLALLLAQSKAKLWPAQREAIVAACNEYLQGGDEPKVDQSALQAADDLLEAVSRSVIQERSGNVTGSLEAVVIDRREKLRVRAG